MHNKLFSGHVPSYISIYNSLYSDIMNNIYPAGDVLPSEQLLAEKYKVSRNTLRQALAILSEDGLILKSRGRGTIVAPRTDKTVTKRIFNPMTALCNGRVDSVEAHYSYATPTAAARTRLGLGKSEILLVGGVTYRAGGVAVGHARMQVPARVLELLDVSVSDEDSVRTLLTTTLFDAAAKQSLAIKLIYADEMEAGILQTEAGRPLLLIESILYHASHEPLARCKFYFLPEHYELQFVLQ